jgi:hypothetical protein
MLEINITDINALYILCYTLNYDKKISKEYFLTMVSYPHEREGLGGLEV